jgi:hypothetical protein
MRSKPLLMGMMARKPFHMIWRQNVGGTDKNFSSQDETFHSLSDVGEGKMPPQLY